MPSCILNFIFRLKNLCGKYTMLNSVEKASRINRIVDDKFIEEFFTYRKSC